MVCQEASALHKYVAARRILKDEYLAEDAVHQAFLRLLGQLEKVDEAQTARTKSFLVILAQCAALDIYRRRKKERQILAGEWEEVASLCGEMPENAATGTVVIGDVDYHAIEKGKRFFIYWTDEVYAYTLLGWESKEELLKMAESI